MNEFNRKPAHAVPNWQAPASTEKKQPAIEESQVEGATATKEWAKTSNGTYVAPWKNATGYKPR